MFEISSEAPHVLEGHRQHVRGLVDLFSKDRAHIEVADRPDLPLHFKNVVQKKIAFYDVCIDASVDEITSFSDWIATEPQLCPGLKLCAGTYDAKVIDRTSTPRAGDIADLAHIRCLPYVDILTADNQMRTYATQASNRFKLGLQGRLQKNLLEVIATLSCAGST